MNTERLQLLLDQYAAHFPEEGVPARLQTLWQAAEQCAPAFDPAAEDLPAMLHAAFDGAAALINYTGSVQPLNGLLFLAESENAALRPALSLLASGDGGDLAARQAKMQAFCEQCNPPLQAHAEGKRAWEQNLRGAIAYLAFLRPEENYLYKPTEARYLADMLGFDSDVSSGPHFTLAAFYMMCDELCAAIARHDRLSAALPEAGTLPPAALRHLMVGDLLLNAGPKKLALFGDAQPLILSRSRAGQANQERMLQISRLQLEMDEARRRAEAVGQALAALSVPELTGQRVASRAFGEAVVLRAEGSLLLVDAGGVQRRFSQPACFLQGHLTPVDPDLKERYASEQRLLKARKEAEAAVIDLQCQISRLQQKP